MTTPIAFRIPKDWEIPSIEEIAHDGAHIVHLTAGAVANGASAYATTGTFALIVDFCAWIYPFAFVVAAIAAFIGWVTKFFQRK